MRSGRVSSSRAIALSLIASFGLDRAISHAFFFECLFRAMARRGRRRAVVGARCHSHRRPLAGARLRRGGLDCVAREFRQRTLTVVATLCRLCLHRPGAFDRDRGRTEVGDQRRLPVGPRGVRRDRPYVSLFADRPDSLPRAMCFPGAHAASGFAFMFGYFLLRDVARRRARWALAGAILLGIAFSIGQQARGAHFISHDLTRQPSYGSSSSSCTCGCWCRDRREFPSHRGARHRDFRLNRDEPQDGRDARERHERP